MQVLFLLQPQALIPHILRCDVEKVKSLLQSIEEETDVTHKEKRLQELLKERCDGSRTVLHTCVAMCAPQSNKESDSGEFCSQLGGSISWTKTSLVRVEVLNLPVLFILETKFVEMLVNSSVGASASTSNMNLSSVLDNAVSSAVDMLTSIQVIEIQSCSHLANVHTAIQSTPCNEPIAVSF